MALPSYNLGQGESYRRRLGVSSCGLGLAHLSVFLKKKSSPLSVVRWGVVDRADNLKNWGREAMRGKPVDIGWPKQGQRGGMGAVSTQSPLHEGCPKASKRVRGFGPNRVPIRLRRASLPRDPPRSPRECARSSECAFELLRGLLGPALVRWGPFLQPPSLGGPSKFVHQKLTCYTSNP